MSYSPTIGRFLEQDPNPDGQYKDGMDLYQFERSSPEDFVDPSGLQADSTTGPNSSGTGILRPPHALPPGFPGPRPTTTEPTDPNRKMPPFPPGTKVTILSRTCTCPVGKAVRFPVNVTVHDDSGSHPLTDVPIWGTTDDDGINPQQPKGAGGNTTGDGGNGYVIINGLKVGNCKFILHVGPSTTQISVDVLPTTQPTTQP